MTARVPPPPTHRESALVRALPWQWASSGLNTVFTSWTISGSVFLLFLGELELPKSQIGVVLSLFPFCGLLALWFAPIARRIGRKRVFLACYGTRKVVIAGLLLLPLFAARRGPAAGLAWLLAVVGLFAVLRALAETAYYPWAQEAVPNRVRGMFSAVTTLVSTVTGAGALLVAGAAIAGGTGIDRYLVLIGAGCAVGLAGVALMAAVPGGKPALVPAGAAGHLRDMRSALRDRNFVGYLGGLGCTTIGAGLFLSFLPLYLRERLGVASGTVVTLDVAVMVGGALSGLASGWAADRWGSRPVLMPALALNLLVPLGWLLLPRGTPNVELWCAVLYVASGVATSGASIGATRLLFNGVVPPENSTAYTAIYYAWIGLTGGAAPLLAGATLSAWAKRSLVVLRVSVDAHAALFVLALVLLALGLALYSRVRPDGPHTTRSILRSALVRLGGPRDRA